MLHARNVAGVTPMQYYSSSTTDDDDDHYSPLCQLQPQHPLSPTLQPHPHIDLSRQLESLASALALSPPTEGSSRNHLFRSGSGRSLRFGHIGTKHLLPVFVACLILFSLSNVFEFLSARRGISDSGGSMRRGDIKLVDTRPWGRASGGSGSGGGNNNNGGKRPKPPTAAKGAPSALSHVVPKRQLCLKMPSEASLRILLVALPPPAFFHASRIRERVNQTLGLGRFSPFEANVRAMWHFSQTRTAGSSSSRATGSASALMDFTRRLKLKRLKQALFLPAQLPTVRIADETTGGSASGTDSTTPAVVTSGRIGSAYRLVDVVFSPLIRAQKRFQFLYDEEPASALERSLIAAFMQSRYVRIIDGNAITRALLDAADYVIVPFPMLRMRSQDDVVAKFRSIMATRVPSFMFAPEKHVFLWSRPVEDALFTAGGSGDDQSGSLQTILSKLPLAAAQLITVEPFRIPGGPQRQHAVPYFGLLQRYHRPAYVREEEERLVQAAIADLAARSSNGRGAADSSSSARIDFIQPWDPLHAGNAPPLPPPRSASGDPNAPHDSGGGAFSRKSDGGGGVGGGKSASCDPLTMGAHRVGACSTKEMKLAVKRYRRFLAVYVGESALSGKEERATALTQLSRCPECAVFDVLSMRRWTGWDGAGIAWAYRSSTFCVHPPGEHLSGRGLFDSMLLGCIPVILDREDLAVKGRAPVLPFSWGLGYSEFVVTLPKATWDARLVETLRAVPATRIRAMQLRLARVAPLLQYDLPDRYALDGILARTMRGASAAQAPAAADGSAEHAAGSGTTKGTSSCAEDAFDTLIVTMYHRRLSASAAAGTTAGGGAPKQQAQVQHGSSGVGGRVAPLPGATASGRAPSSGSGKEEQSFSGESTGGEKYEPPLDPAVPTWRRMRKALGSSSSCGSLLAALVAAVSAAGMKARRRTNRRSLRRRVRRRSRPDCLQIYRDQPSNFSLTFSQRSSRIVS